MITVNPCDLSKNTDPRPLTKRHLGEEVMDYMVMRNIVQEEAALPAQERSVNSCSCATLIVPLFHAVMRQIGIGVVQVSNHDEPMRDQQPWDSIVFENGGGGIQRAGVFDAPRHCQETEVGQYYSVSLAFSEEDRVGWFYLASANAHRKND